MLFHFYFQSTFNRYLGQHSGHLRDIFFALEIHGQLVGQLIEGLFVQSEAPFFIIEDLELYTDLFTVSIITEEKNYTNKVVSNFFRKIILSHLTISEFTKLSPPLSNQ